MSDSIFGLPEFAEPNPFGVVPNSQPAIDLSRLLPPILANGLSTSERLEQIQQLQTGSLTDPILGSDPQATIPAGRTQNVRRTLGNGTSTPTGDGGLGGTTPPIDPLTGDPLDDSSTTPDGSTGAIEPTPTPTSLPTAPTSPGIQFTSGAFTALSATASVEFQWDGGGYSNTQLGIFSLEGMEQFTGDAFHREAARRATTNSPSGHLLIDDRTEGAKFSGKLNHEDNFNQGPFNGVKTFSITPGAKYGLILIPDGALADIATGAAQAEGSRRPLYSMATANPDQLFQAGQLVEAGSDPTRGNTYIFEDLRLDQGSDRDYNDIVVRLRGFSGSVPSIDQYIDPNKDWRKQEAGKLLLADALPYVTVEPSQPTPTQSPSPSPATGNEPSGSSSTTTPPTPAPSPTPPTTESPAPSTPVPNTPVPSTTPIISPLGTFPWTYPTIEDLAAAAITPTSKFPIIGVIDTGFARSNPDLDYSKIVWGKDYIDNDADPLLNPGEGNEHGTHILGLISALRNNGVGIDGLAPDAPIWAARAVGSGSWAKALVDYVDYIKSKGQTRGLVNLSFDLTQKNADGTISTRYEFTPEERVAIETARQAGVVLVVAAGNSGTGEMSVLAQAAQEFDNIISVAAAEQIDRSVAIADGAAKTDYSSSGKKLTISAIGGSIEQGIPSLLEEGLGTMAGTSVATAKVTANAALAWAANPSLNYLQLKDVLTKTATDIEASGYDELTGYGIVNGAAAVSLAKMTKGEAYSPEPWFAPDSWNGEGFATPWEREVAALDSYAIKIRPDSSGYMERFLLDARWYEMSAEAVERDDVRRNFLGYSHASFRNFVDFVPPRISNDIRLVPVAYHAGVPYKWTTKSTSSLKAELGRDPTFDDLVRIARPDLTPGDPAYGAFFTFLVRQHKARPVGTTGVGQTGILSSSPLVYIPQPWTELTNFATLVPDTISLANSAYAKNGGSSKLGSPTSGQGLGKFDSQNYPSLIVKSQVLTGGSEGAGALVLNRAENEAFWIRGDVFINHYMIGAAEFGLPTSDRYTFGTGERQDFEKGAVFYVGNFSFPLTSLAGEHYQKTLTNAQRNQLGMMTGSAMLSRDGLIYPFAGGTLNYRYTSGISVEFNSVTNSPLVNSQNWTDTGTVRLQDPPQPSNTRSLPSTPGTYSHSVRSPEGVVNHYYSNGYLTQQPGKQPLWYVSNRLAYTPAKEAFSLTVADPKGVNYYTSPSLNSKTATLANQGQAITFEGWVEAEAVPALYTNKADTTWVKVKGSDLWMPRALMNGYPPGHPNDSNLSRPLQTGEGSIEFTTGPSRSELLLNGYDSILGTAKSEIATAGMSPNGTTGLWQSYQNGSIHYSEKYGAVPLWFGLNSTYGSQGGSSGWMGFPTRREYDWLHGRRTDFEGGFLFFDPKDNIVKAYRLGQTPLPSGFKDESFSLTVASVNGIALRNSPALTDFSTATPVAKGDLVRFDGWARGESVKRLYTDIPDDVWLKLEGRDLWVPRAFMNGHPPSIDPYKPTQTGEISKDVGIDIEYEIPTNNSQQPSSELSYTIDYTPSTRPNTQLTANINWISPTASRGQSVLVSGQANTSKLMFSINGQELGGSLTHFSDGTFSAQLNLPDNLKLGDYQLQVDVQDQSGVTKSVSYSPVFGVVTDQRVTVPVGKTNGGVEKHITFERVNSPGYIENRRTWVVIHGWDGEAKHSEDVAKAIEEYDGFGGDQVLTLDWDAARTGQPYLKAAATWIETVGKAAAKILKDRFDISPSNINLVGHSLGSLVSYEIAKNLNGIDKLVALAPASTTDGGYSNESAVDFRRYSDWSWGFHGSGNILTDSADKSRTAHESFPIDFGLSTPWDAHGAVRTLWANMLRAPSNPVAGYFGLEDMSSDNKPWFIDGGSEWEAKISVPSVSNPFPNKVESRLKVAR